MVAAADAGLTVVVVAEVVVLVGVVVVIGYETYDCIVVAHDSA